jgi:hypothetical protein
MYLNLWKPDFDPKISIPFVVHVWVCLPLHCWGDDVLKCWWHPKFWV